MRTLKVISGPAEGKSVPVEAEVIIGREDADLTIPDAQLSRRHAAVRPSNGGGVIVRDLGSTNGTYVGGRRINEPVTLDPGGTLRVGSSEIAFEVVTPSIPRPQPTQPSGTLPVDLLETPPAAAAASVPTTASPTPAAPPTAPPRPRADEEEAPAEPAPRRRRPGRRPAWLLVLLIIVGLVAIAATVAAIALALQSEETTTRTLDARITALPLADPTATQSSGVVEGEPLGRAAVIFQRQLERPPEPGGTPVPLTGSMLVISSDGSLSLNVRGTLRVTEGGGEVVEADGTASNGTRDYEGVEGTFRLTGGRPNARSLHGRFNIDGTLEY